MEENFSPVSPEMYEEKQTEEKPIKTAADRLRETVNMPDFGISEIQTNDEIFKEAPTPLPLDIAHKLVDGAKIREGVGEQTAVAIENALTGIGAFGDQATLAFGQITSAVTGNTIAEDFMDTAVKNLEMRMEDMKYAEDSVGGIRNLIAQLAGGTVSMGELLLVSAATGGMGGYVQMGVQAFGEGAFNDMEKYKEEHGGSLKGYQPKNLDIAINAGNAFLQAVIEKKFGVSSPRFLTGLSRGLVAEGASGFLQESTQSALADLAEYVKGNKEVEGWLNDAEGWIRDGIVGAILQGSLGAATYNYAHNNAVKFYAKARAQSQGRETPNNEDTTFGKNIVNAKERGYSSALTQEFKAAFDASTGEGQLQAKIASALKKAAETKELDLDTANETEMAQRIEQIATQETLNAMDYAREQNRAISDMELNDIVYKDGAIWLEGLTPEVGDKAVSYARVLAERQSGLAEVNMKLDTINQEIATLKKDLAEAKQQNQEARAEVLQARIDKQNAIAEKNRVRAEKLKAQTSKLEQQIAKQQMEAPKAEPIEMAKVEEVKPVEAPKREVLAQIKKKEPIAERKSLKEERVAKKAPSVDDEGLLHQAKPEKIEEKNLVATHAIKLEGIKEALRVGGFAMPSLAIQKEINNSYGEIIFIAPAEMAIPSRTTKVYDRDAWTPMINFIEYTAKDGFYDRVKDILESKGYNPNSASTYVYNIEEKMKEGVAEWNTTAIELFGIDKGYIERGQEDEMRSMIDTNADIREEYYKWYESFIYPNMKPRIFKGYTNLGNRRYVPATLENIVKELKTQPEHRDFTWNDTFFFHDVARELVTRFKSLKEIKKSSARLVSDSEVSDRVHELSSEYYALAEELKLDESSHNPEILLSLALIEGKGTIADKLETVGLKHNTESVKKVQDIVKKIQELPVKYFEGKVRKAVKFNEFSAVFVPDSQKYNEVSSKLQEEGVNVIRYDSSIDLDEKFNNLVQENKNILFQGSISGKGDTNRGGYDDALKRIILGEKSDLSTIQHEFAHYWIQNNFKWARSGLASQDWLRRWRDVEEWLGIEPQDRLLSRSASEKFAKAYERYILEGKVAPELQWAFEGFQKAYQDIYDDLENEYFDLDEELAPEVIDWFNRNKEQSPKRLLQADEKKLEKALTLASGTAVMEDVAGTVVMTEPEANGDQKVYMGVKESEIPAGDNLLVQADKTTASKLQRSAKNILSDKVEVQQLATLDTQATLKNFKDWIARDRAGAWNAMMNPDTRPIYRTYLYKAFAEEALNDADLAVELANIDMAESVRELGQAIQALDIRNESGFDTIKIIRNIEKSKGKISKEELNKEVESIGLDMIELSQDEIDEVDFDTECKL